MLSVGNGVRVAGEKPTPLGGVVKTLRDSVVDVMMYGVV